MPWGQMETDEWRHTENGSLVALIFVSTTQRHRIMIEHSGISMCKHAAQQRHLTKSRIIRISLKVKEYILVQVRAMDRHSQYETVSLGSLPECWSILILWECCWDFFCFFFAWRFRSWCVAKGHGKSASQTQSLQKDSYDHLLICWHND